jgi:Ran GTPase-activating protein (RanGAP) involved in mRNA processing and transport
MQNKIKNWEELANDGEQYGGANINFSQNQKTIFECIRDKTVLKIQDKYVFSKSGQNLAENHGRELAALIAHFEPLKIITSLIITHNDLGAEGIRLLAESSVLGNVEYLHLGSNNIGDEGVKILSQSSIFANIHTLNLECNKITAEGARALANSVFTKLTSLNLVDNRIGDEGANLLADSDTLANLTYLHLGGNRIKSEEARDALRNSKKLSRLQTLKIF